MDVEISKIFDSLNSLVMGRTNDHPDFENSPKNYFTSLPSD